MEDIDRIVKCRIRSEVEARKAVESSLKRAMKESFDVKKELCFLRQEVKELKSKDTSAVELTRQREKVLKLNKKLKQNQEEHETELNQLKIQLEESIQKNKDNVKRWEGNIEEHEKTERDLRMELSELKQKYSRILSTYKEEKRSSNKSLDEFKRLHASSNQEKQQLQDKLRYLKLQVEKTSSSKSQIRELVSKSNQLKEQLESEKRRFHESEKRWNHKYECNKDLWEKERQSLKKELKETVKCLKVLKLEKEQVEHEEKKEMEGSGNKDENHIEELNQKNNQLEDEIQRMRNSVEEVEDELNAMKVSYHLEKQATTVAEEAAMTCENRAKRAESEYQKLKDRMRLIEDALNKRGIHLDFVLKLTKAKSENSVLPNNQTAEGEETCRRKNQRYESRRQRKTPTG